MNIVVSQTGIDVAKDELVVSVDGGKPFRVPNDREGCQSLLGRLPPETVVHLEASGGYERLVCRVLGDAGIQTVLHNPLKPRRLAQALGTRAKTDPVDARVLSVSGALLPRSRAKSLGRQNLADHSRAIDVLKESVGDLKKRMRMPELDEAAKKLYADCVSDLERRIEAAEKAFHRRAESSELSQSYRLVQSVPGLGRITARIFVCEVPEDLFRRETAQIASYAGLAPIDDSSGRRESVHIGHGNPRLKRAFYMPAICAVRSQGWAKELYARLRAKGKAHQSAIVAVMRRLLIRAVAVVKQGFAWQEKPLTGLT